jgi:hypothetical protein
VVLVLVDIGIGRYWYWYCYTPMKHRVVFCRVYSSRSR